MNGEPKILLMRLFERTSERGTRYLFGRLGSAKVIAFIDREAELRYGAEAVWNVFVQAADQDNNRSTTASSSPSTPRRMPRRQAPRPAADPRADSDGRPFNDPLDNVGIAP